MKKKHIILLIIFIIIMFFNCSMNTIYKDKNEINDSRSNESETVDLDNDLLNNDLSINKSATQKGTHFWHYWWDGSKYIIPYQYHKNATSAVKRDFTKAASIIEKVARVKFLYVPGRHPVYFNTIYNFYYTVNPITNRNISLLIVKSTSGDNRADVGYFDKPNPEICLTGKDGIGVVLHELIHVLGFVHEHQRNDHEDFVSVIADGDYERQYEELQTHEHSPYDYFSIMHLFLKSESEGDSSIELLGNEIDQYIKDYIGNELFFTEKDMKGLQKFYKVSSNDHKINRALNFRIHPSKYMFKDIEYFHDSSSIELGSFDHLKNASWEINFEYREGHSGYYIIRNKATGLYLHADGSGKVSLGPRNDAYLDKMLWELFPTNYGGHAIGNKYNRLYLEYNYNTNEIFCTKASYYFHDPNQRWIIEPLGTVRISNRSASGSLSPRMGSSSNEKSLWIDTTPGNTEYEKWFFGLNDDGTFSIFNLQYNLFIAIDRNSTDDNVGISQKPLSTGDRAKWHIEFTDYGYIKLKNHYSKKYLDYYIGYSAVQRKKIDHYAQEWELHSLWYNF